MSIESDLKPWLPLPILLAALPLVVSNPYYLGVATFACLNAINVLGLNLLMGYAGQVSMGVAGFFGLGAYASGIVCVHYGFDPLAGILVATTIGWILGALVGMPALRLHGHYLAMATLGIGIVFYILFVETTWLTGGPDGLAGIPEIQIGPWALETDLQLYALAALTLAIMALLCFRLVGSLYGHAMRAMGQNEAGIRSLGVNTHAMKVLVFALGSGMSAFSGALYAHMVYFISPETFGFHASILFVIMAVFGGLGSIWGSILGAAIFTALPELLVSFADYDVLIYGMVLLLTILFLPRGLAGLVADLRARKVHHV